LDIITTFLTEGGKVKIELAKSFNIS